jgi:hypothetical protein
VHLTIATELEADIGVSGTKEGVEVGPGFFGVGSSRRTRAAGLSGSNRRCFLEEIWTGVESPFSSSSSERRIGWGILGSWRNCRKRIGGESGVQWWWQWWVFFSVSSSNKRGMVGAKRCVWERG